MEPGEACRLPYFTPSDYSEMQPFSVLPETRSNSRKREGNRGEGCEDPRTSTGCEVFLPITTPVSSSPCRLDSKGFLPLLPCGPGLGEKNLKKQVPPSPQGLGAEGSKDGVRSGGGCDSRSA